MKLERNEKVRDRSLIDVVGCFKASADADLRGNRFNLSELAKSLSFANAVDVYKDNDKPARCTAHRTPATIGNILTVR